MSGRRSFPVLFPCLAFCEPGDSHQLGVSQIWKVPFNRLLGQGCVLVFTALPWPHVNLPLAAV